MGGEVSIHTILTKGYAQSSLYLRRRFLLVTRSKMSPFMTLVLFEIWDDARNSVHQILQKLTPWRPVLPVFPRAQCLVLDLHPDSFRGVLEVSSYSDWWPNSCRAGWWVTFLSWHLYSILRCLQYRLPPAIWKHSMPVKSFWSQNDAKWRCNYL